MRRAGGAWLLACACALLGAARAAPSLGAGVCQTMDIRNGPDSFEKLRNCTVIEGRLSIVLIERYNYSHFDGISFPQLREITDYLIIYRVKGLRSVGQLFPNLSVIRGTRLFRDFALVLFDNEDMQTVGLSKLTNIRRGAVRIERNYKLCYVDTINWAVIAPFGDGNNIIKSNHYTVQCGSCPGEGDLSAKQCPMNSYGQYLCWNGSDCQKACPSKCGVGGACTDNGLCCDASCLGGCWGPRADQCFVCRNFSIGHGDSRRCVGVCPPSTYMHYNRRCVTQLECQNMPPPVGEEQDKDMVLATNRTYKILDNTCVYNCPLGYFEVVGGGGAVMCQRCEGVCTRVCASGKIDSLESAQRFKGCTHISGSLEIVMRGGVNVMSELETCLGLVEVIDGQLKVWRSFALITLSFFKSLRRIKGLTNNSPRVALSVLDNPNLEELWNWKTHGDIVIEGGKLSVHLNPKLCYDQIKPLKAMAKDSVFDDIEVSASTNGDKASCNRTSLNMTVYKLTATAAVMRWNQYCMSDQRQLLGYSLYYTKAQHNLTLYEKRDACQDVWSVDDVSMDMVIDNETSVLKYESDKARCDRMQPIFHLLPRLVPYTRYAAYVKTYTTQSDYKGAQSPIIYFNTLPAKPSPPTIQSLESAGPNEMTVRWQKPYVPNGNLTTYHILLTWEEDHPDASHRRNFCLQPPPAAPPLRPKEEERVRKKAEEANRAADGACNCEDKIKPASIFTEIREAEQHEAIDFENDLQNMVYVKHLGRDRPRRSLQADGTLEASHMHSEEPPPLRNQSVAGYYKVVSIARPANVTELTVHGLRHYAQYVVSVWACRELDPSELHNHTGNNCSMKTTQTMRTPTLERADLVTSVHAEVLAGNRSTPGVRVSWQPPATPNGPVLLYNIKHSRLDNDNVVGTAATTCVTSKDFDHLGFHQLRNLAPGNYTITVSAVTLAGSGPVSEKAIVFIPERDATSSGEWVVGVVAGSVAAVVLMVAALWYARRGLRPGADNNKLFASVNPEYVSTVYVPDEWEVPRSNVELVRELGQGSFGMVYEGIAKDIIKDVPETRCAVKTVNEHATDRERVDFLNEASVMKAFDTWHVVRLLGVVSRGQPTLVVMELMERGDLKSYLRSHRPDQDGSLPTSGSAAAAPSGTVQPPTLQQIKQMAIEIADGMSYLAAKKFVHRDLAARNCMVAGDMTVKVGDFGMTRDIYETDYYRKGSKGLLPVRWMSPESLKDGVFSSSSDVWSFGVVLWEMATLAMQPYQGLSNEQVLRYVVEGGVMERPEHCPDGLYELMRSCWSHRPSARPTFMRLVAELAPAAAPHFRQRSFFHSPTGQEIYAQQQNQEDEEQVEVQVGALAGDSASNMFGVSGRLASWVRELSSLRSRSADDDDAAAEPLTPLTPRALPYKGSAPNGLLAAARYTREPARSPPT